MTPEQIQYLKTLVPPPPGWGGTGATPLSHDPRDYDIRSLPGVADALAAGVPNAVDLTGFIRGEILNQGASGACVAFSTAHLCAMDEVISGDPWPNVNAPLMYSRAGGTGSNGVDTRLVLSQAIDSGVPLVSGGSINVLQSYAFVPQQPGVFTDVLKAALAAGYPCVLALLLPTDFGWQSGHGAVSQGYHQICLIGYTADGYWLFVNSWGASWPGSSPHAGVGSVLQSFVEANNFQQRYAYSYTVTAAGTGPPPPPPKITVTGYHPNPVPSGQALSIAGSNFDAGALAVTWQGQNLPVLGMNPDVIATKAPQVANTGSAPVHVQVGNTGADGPPLTVTADTPIPPPVKTKAQVTGQATGADVSGLAPGQTYPLGSGITLTLSTVTFTDDGPPPPGQLAVTGYSPTTVTQGQQFQILGSGFAAGGNLTVTWGGQTLTANRVSDTVIQATAPAVANGANPVTVQIGAATATGPLLQIGDGGPPPIEGIKVLLTVKPSQLRNTVSVIAYTTDANGNSLPASVSGQIVGSQGTVQLDGKTTHGSQAPATWLSIPRPSPWGTECTVTVTAFGSGLTGTASKPG